MAGNQETEYLPHILGVYLPQNANTEDAGKDLLANSTTFRDRVGEFDKTLGLPSGGSLEVGRQLAPVAFAYGVRAALAEKLGGRIFGSATALSIGNHNGLIDKGFLTPTQVARGLQIRQEETEPKNTPDGAIKTMLTIVGVDPGIIMKRLEEAKYMVGEGVEAAIANINAPTEGVLAVRIAQGADDLRTSVAGAITTIKAFFPDIPELDPRWIKRIRNAFHSPFMDEEQEQFQSRTAELIQADPTSEPNPNVHFFSSSMHGWVETRQQAVEDFFTQLTKETNLRDALLRIRERFPFVAAVTFDPTNKLFVSVLQRNFGNNVEILNAYDSESVARTADRIDFLSRRTQSLAF